MRLRSFLKFLEINGERNNINNSSLVIDVHNYFYGKYTKSNLQYLFGCECNSYANFLREELSIFLKANVKCHFLFKGGNGDNKKLLNLYSLDETPKSKVFHNHENYQPLLIREVYKQVLDDMGFDYAICDYGCKRECVALAQKLNCPILALDTEYFFFGVQYVTYTSLMFNPFQNTLECKIFVLDTFMKKFKLDKKQIAIFITIFDEKVFPKEFNDNLLKKLQVPLSYKKRHYAFLQWLSNNGSNAMEIISKYIKQSDYLEMQSEIEQKDKTIVNIQEPGSLPTQYFLDMRQCQINKSDPEWFTKGIVCKFIPIPYINIYRWRIVEGSWSIEDHGAEDSILLSAPIIRYAFDLLTNFNNEEIAYKGRQCIQITEDGNETTTMDSDFKILQSISKPEYGSNNVFENGWDNIHSFKLFEHFLMESLQISDLNVLQRAPSDAKLLIISLVYFTHQKSINVSNEVYAILLSYVMLGVLSDNTKHEETLKPNDCKYAKTLMDEYFYISDEEMIDIFDQTILHPLVEFQHCLRQMNFLNTLCGSLFTETVYSKTYNATFVYKILYNMKQKFLGNGHKFLEETLRCIPTVLSYLNNIFHLYKEINQLNQLE